MRVPLLRYAKCDFSWQQRLYAYGWSLALLYYLHLLSLFFRLLFFQAVHIFFLPANLLQPYNFIFSSSSGIKKNFWLNSTSLETYTYILAACCGRTRFVLFTFFACNVRQVSACCCWVRAKVEAARANERMSL